GGGARAGNRKPRRMGRAGRGSEEAACGDALRRGPGGWGLIQLRFPHLGGPRALNPTTTISSAPPKRTDSDVLRNLIAPFPSFAASCSPHWVVTHADPSPIDEIG